MPPYKRKPKRDPQTEPERAIDVLQALFVGESSAFANQFKRWKLWAQWSDVVGASIAAVTEPLAIYDQKILIWVSNPSWNHHLSYMKSEILQKINRDFGDPPLKDIHFTLTKRSTVNKDDKEITDSLKKILTPRRRDDEGDLERD